MQLRQRFFCLCFIFALAPVQGWAGSEPTLNNAATESTTQPTTVADVVIGSPKSALKAYNLAMRNGDVPGMMALQHAVSDDEMHVARCSSQADLEVAALEQAMRDKFGETGEQQIAAAMGDEDDVAVEAATESVHGLHGGVKFADSAEAVPMIRVEDGSGEHWAVDVGTTLRDSNGDADSLCDQIIRRGSAAKVTAQEIAAGQFTTIAAAVEALKSRLKENGLSDAATQP